MRLALLGVDSAVLELLANLPAGIDVVWGCELEPAVAEVARLVPGIELADEWEALLSGGVADAVVVAAAVPEERSPEQESRTEQVRRLAAAGVAMIVAHPLPGTSLDYYEIDIARREAGAVVIPWLPARLHPTIAELVQLLGGGDENPIGSVEQVVFERAMPDRTLARVREQFARDVDLLRLLCGELTHISAMRPGGAQATTANITVQLSGPGGILARWSLEPASGGAEGRLILIGTTGKATLHMPDDQRPWRLQGIEPTQPTAEWPHWRPGRALLEQLAIGLEGGQPALDWLSTIRTLELWEAVERSLARGRQVELRWQENVEESNFKSTMTAVGCGVLIFGVITLLFAAAAQKVAEQMGFRWLAARLGDWPEWMIALLVLFLLLQLLRLVFPSKEVKRTEVSTLESEEA